MNFKAVFELLRETFHDWNEDKASRLSAALAYFTMFSIAPLLVIAISIAGLVFGQQAAQNQILAQVQGLVGQQSAQMIQTMIQNASKPSASITATIIGIVTLLLGASGVFGALQDSLNTIWGVAPSPRAGWKALVRDRFMSFTMILGVGFLLLVSLVLSAALAAVGKFVGNLLPGSTVLAEAINFVISFGVVTLLFAMIYKVLPDVKIAWSDVWIGAVATAFLFSIGRLLIGLYLGRGAVGSSYGAAGSLVAILVWVYYSAMILFFGAEFTKVYAYRYGSHIEPAETAVPVTEEARAEQGIPSTERREEGARQKEGQPAHAGRSTGNGSGQPRTAPEPAGAGAQANPVQAGSAQARAGQNTARDHERDGSARTGLASYLLEAAGVALTVVAFASRRRL